MVLRHPTLDEFKQLVRFTNNFLCFRLPSDGSLIVINYVVLPPACLKKNRAIEPQTARASSAASVSPMFADLAFREQLFRTHLASPQCNQPALDFSADPFPGRGSR